MAKKNPFKEFFATSWAVENRTSAFILAGLIVLGGFMAYRSLPKEQFPDVVVPTIYVTTVHPGTSPEDVENLITKPLEKEMKGISGLEDVNSKSLQNFSVIVAEFNTELETKIAKDRVKDAVDQARTELPDDLEQDPLVKEMDVSEIPIMNIHMAGNYSHRRLKEWSEDLQDRIEGMSEIRRVDLVGVLDREIQINVDLYRMQANGVTFNDIEQAVASENVNISGGDMDMDNLERSIRVTGEFEDPREITNVVVRTPDGHEIRLGEIASVEDTYEERESYARLDHKPVVSLNVIKRGGENLLAASDKINKLLNKLQQEKFPEGLSLTITGDQSHTTRTNLTNLFNTVIIGFIFVVLVLMFFMGTTNASFVGLAIPLSALVAFGVLPMLDFTMNMIVLFSFLLALGITVDNAIVVIENTHRILNTEPGMDVKTAAKKAAGEVFLPVFSGTLTTIAPFFPLLFWPGIMGKFMVYLPITLIIVLFASLFVAFVLNPVFAARFMKKDQQLKQLRHRPVFKRLRTPLAVLIALTLVAHLAIGPLLGNILLFITAFYLFDFFLLDKAIAWFRSKVVPALVRSYRNQLRWLIRGVWRPAGAIITSVVLLVLTIMALARFGPPVEFFPQTDPNFVYVYNEMPVGTRAEVTDSVTREIEERVYQVLGPNNPAVKSVIANVGVSAGNPQDPVPDRDVTPHKSKVTVAFKVYEEREGVDTKKILEQIRERVQGIPGTAVTAEQEQSGPPTGPPVNIEIAGDSLRTLNRLAFQLKQKIREAGVQGLEGLTSNLKLNKPEVIVDINKEKAQREGIKTAVLAQQIRTGLYGKEISQFRGPEDEYPIMLRLKKTYRDNLEDLLNMQVRYMDQKFMTFREVPLRALADFHYSTGYSSINRINQERVATLSSNLVGDYTANEVLNEIRPIIQGMDLPPGYQISITGQQEDQQETFNFLIYALMASVLLAFMIMMFQFNSFSKPLIIMATIALSFIGVFLGFTVLGLTISIVMTGVGIVSLAGIVVNNGILLIEFMDEQRKRGLSLQEGVIEGGAIRLTPILLTAASTVLGLLPMGFGLNIDFEGLFRSGNPGIYFGGDSAALWSPLAWTIIFGLTVSTFLTLFVVPSMYYLSEKLKLRLKKQKPQRDSGEESQPESVEMMTT